jgi:hypothetical protein
MIPIDYFLGAHVDAPANAGAYFAEVEDCDWTITYKYEATLIEPV